MDRQRLSSTSRRLLAIFCWRHVLSLVCLLVLTPAGQNLREKCIFRTQIRVLEDDRDCRVGAQGRRKDRAIPRLFPRLRVSLVGAREGCSCIYSSREWLMVILVLLFFVDRVVLICSCVCSVCARFSPAFSRRAILGGTAARYRRTIPCFVELVHPRRSVARLVLYTSRSRFLGFCTAAIASLAAANAMYTFPFFF